MRFLVSVMGGIIDLDECPICGEEFWYDYDGRTGEFTKLTMCRCDRIMVYVEEFLKSRGLLEEFEKYVEEMERRRL